MELQQIIERYVEGLAQVDATTTTQVRNPRTGELYPLSLRSLSEVQVVEELDSWWGRTHPGDFARPGALHGTRFPYPDLPRAACDQVLTTDREDDRPEWAIEVKKIALVGNNGKRNDFAVGKVLSPFLKDRSLLHDVARLRAHQIGRRQAVIGISFRYDAATCAEALRRHPASAAAIAEIGAVCRSNEGELSLDALINMCDGILRVRNLVVAPVVRLPFTAWRHPCGGEGTVFGWEVSAPGGPQHPW